MKAALRQFKNDIDPGDEVVVFYAGHGVQLGGANYLIPVDTHGESEDAVRIRVNQKDVDTVALTQLAPQVKALQAQASGGPENSPVIISARKDLLLIRSGHARIWSNR